MTDNQRLIDLDDGMGTRVKVGVCVEQPRVFVDLYDSDRSQFVSAWLKPHKVRKLAKALKKAARKAER